MAKPIEATPVLDNEEWTVFLNTIQNTKREPLRIHSVDVEEIRKIMKRKRQGNESAKRK